MPRTLLLAVVPGDGIGTKSPLRLSRCLMSWPRPRRRLRTHGVRPRCATLACHGGDAAAVGAGRDPRARRDPARRRRRPERPLRRPRARAAAQAAVRARPLRQPAAIELYPWRRDPAGGSRRDRHDRLPRGHRGSIRRQRGWARVGTPARRGDRSQREHGLRRRARRPGSVRARTARPAQEADAGPQEQRLVYAGTCGDARWRRWRRSFRTSLSIPCTSMPQRSSWSPTRAASTSS